jgi:hypothetical protein
VREKESIVKFACEASPARASWGGNNDLGFAAATGAGTGSPTVCHVIIICVWPMPFARSNGALDGWMTHPGLHITS